MDIMGFKDRVYRDNHQSVLETMESFQTSIRAIEGLARKRLTTRGATADVKANVVVGSVVRPVVFSDSILLVSGNDSVDSARRLLSTAAWVVEEAALKSIPI